MARDIKPDLVWRDLKCFEYILYIFCGVFGADLLFYQTRHFPATFKRIRLGNFYVIRAKLYGD